MADVDEEFQKLVLQNDVVAEKLFKGNDGVSTEVTYRKGRIDLVFPYCNGFVGIEVEDTHREAVDSGLYEAENFAKEANAAFLAVPYDQIDQPLKNLCQDHKVGLISIKPGNSTLVQEARFTKYHNLSDKILDRFWISRKSFLNRRVYYPIIDQPSSHDVRFFLNHEFKSEDDEDRYGSLFDLWLELISKKVAIYYLLSMYAFIRAHSFRKFLDYYYIDETTLDLYRSLHHPFGRIRLGRGRDAQYLHTYQDPDWLYAHSLAEYLESPLRIRGENGSFYRLSPWWGYLLAYSEFVQKDFGERLEDLSNGFSWDRYVSWRKKLRKKVERSQNDQFTRYFYEARSS